MSICLQIHLLVCDVVCIDFRFRPYLNVLTLPTDLPVGLSTFYLIPGRDSQRILKSKLLFLPPVPVSYLYWSRGGDLNGLNRLFYVLGVNLNFKLTFDTLYMNFY